jgi:YD repeat-containing protein
VTEKQPATSPAIAGEKKTPSRVIKLGPDNLAKEAHRIWLAYYQAQQQGKQPPLPVFNVPASVEAKEAQHARAVWQQAQLKAQKQVSATNSTNNNKQKTNISPLAETPVNFTYNAMGLRQMMTDSSGITTYTYDVRNRLLSKQTSQGTLTYTYNGVGNLLTVRSSNANGISIDYTYDSVNRLQTVTDNRLLKSEHTRLVQNGSNSRGSDD